MKYFPFKIYFSPSLETLYACLLGKELILCVPNTYYKIEEAALRHKIFIYGYSMMLFHVDIILFDTEQP